LKKGDFMSINKHYSQIKKLKKNPIFPDTYFIGKYSISPYRACEHACKYCDGRAEKYYVEGDFEKDIVIRENMADVLDAGLRKGRERGFVSFGSGVSDPYQPVEAKEGIMRQAAEVVLKHGFAASVMTKNALVMRDIDLWDQVNRKAKMLLYVSLVYPDDKYRKIIEPNASSVEARLETLREFKRRGIAVGVSAMPLIPYISDDESSVRRLFEKLKEIDVDIVMPESMTLRPGIQKKVFFDLLKSEFPELVTRYEYLYSENRQSGIPKKQYSENLYGMLGRLMKEFGFVDMVPHYVYKDQFTIYDELYILLQHMKKLYSRRGINVDQLALASRNYSIWLSDNKKVFNRKRSMTELDLEEKLISEFRMGLMDTVIDNEKLMTFLKAIVFDNKTFDYKMLKLI